MRVAAMFCLGTALSASLGCQRGQTSAPSPVSNTATSGTAAVAPPATVAPPAEPASAPPTAASERVHVALPRAPGTPVRRTRRALTDQQLTSLAAFEFK